MKQVKFSNSTIEAIGNYVYALTDKNDKIFYIGKGSGNRVFNHTNKIKKIFFSRKNDVNINYGQFDDVYAKNNKDKIIARLIDIGVDPKMYIIRYGLTTKEAHVLESALISVFRWQLPLGLTNLVAGHGEKYFGLMQVAQIEARYGAPFSLSDLNKLEKNKEIILININKSWADVEAGRNSLFNVSRGDWSISYKRACNCQFAIIHAYGIVRGVFEKIIWGTSINDKNKLYMTSANILKGDNFENKSASALLGPNKKGNVNPIRYVRFNPI